MTLMTAPTIFQENQNPKQKYQLPLWIEIWLIFSGIVCALDVSFTMLRPMTNKGGSLENVYYFWNMYAEVDLRYARTNDVVTMASGRVMLIEVVLNFLAVFLNRTNSKHTFLVTFSTNLMVLWKTIFYATLFIRVPSGNPDFLNPNATFWQILSVFIIPTCIWIFIPLTILIWLWKRMANNGQQKMEENEESKPLKE